MKTANGSSYNAYLIKTSEGVIIVDTVKIEFQEQFFKKIESLCTYDEIKYVILHHLEPDHAGAIPELMNRVKDDVKVLISPQATRITSYNVCYTKLLRSTTKGSVTSVQAIYVPADDLTDPAPATTFAHLDATTVLSRAISELGIV